MIYSLQADVLRGGSAKGAGNPDGMRKDLARKQQTSRCLQERRGSGNLPAALRRTRERVRGGVAQPRDALQLQVGGQRARGGAGSLEDRGHGLRAVVRTFGCLKEREAYLGA